MSLGNSNDTMAALCRKATPQGFALFYEWVFADSGFKLPSHLWPVVLGLCDQRIRKLQLTVGPGAGKALALDTPVLMWNGEWKPMSGIRVGDALRTPCGVMSIVRAVMPQSVGAMYRLTFSGGRSVVANYYHLWKARIAHAAIGPGGWALVDTSDLFCLVGNGARCAIPALPGDADALDDELLVTSVVRVDDAESICINIDHPDGLFICGDYIVTHNSQVLSVAYPAWCLGLDPTQTIIAISGAENLAQGFMQAVMGIIEHSPAWKAIFPHITPDKGEGWSSDRGMFVTGRKVGIPDSSFWAGGLNSRVLPGKHGKTIIMDDLHTDENSLTEEQCENVVRKYYNTILGRADPQGSRSILAGRRWNEKDLYGHLRDSEDWVVLQLPAERPNSTELYHDVFVPDDLECVFTDGFCHCADGSIYDAGAPP